jgi:hypothetical protein
MIVSGAAIMVDVPVEYDFPTIENFIFGITSDRIFFIVGSFF